MNGKNKEKVIKLWSTLSTRNINIVRHKDRRMQIDDGNLGHCLPLMELRPSTLNGYPSYKHNEINRMLGKMTEVWRHFWSLSKEMTQIQYYNMIVNSEIKYIFVLIKVNSICRGPFMFNHLRWEAIVCFLDIGRIVDHHGLNLITCGINDINRWFLKSKRNKVYTNSEVYRQS